MSFEPENEAKAVFNDMYVHPTPHLYLAEMGKHGYQIGEQARPFCVIAADILSEGTAKAWPVQMLDVGCSYGIASAFVRYGCSFDEIIAFFATRAPTDYLAACEATRSWLNVVPPACDVRCVGMDSSEPAIRFAMDAGLLDGGISQDFESDSVSPTLEDKNWFRSCNLLISTGAIGYVTERTLDVVLEDLGKDHPSPLGPFAVITILRMFDTTKIQEVFAKHGFKFAAVPGIRLPQRRFADDGERDEVLAILHKRGIDTGQWEDHGMHYADLFIAAQPEQFPNLLGAIEVMRAECDKFHNHDVT